MTNYFKPCRKELVNLENLKIPVGTKILDLEYLCLKSLEGCPKGIIEIKAKGNDITSFIGCPKSLIRLDLSNNKLKSLAELLSKKSIWTTPNSKGRLPNLTELNISGNPITSLLGLPKSLKILICDYTNIYTLEGLPKGIEVLSCKYCKLTTDKGKPPNADLSFNYIREN